MTFDFTRTKPDLSRSTKWGNCAGIMGQEPPSDVLPMWIAQMDFAPAPFLGETMSNLQDKGEYGYFTGLDTFQERVCWWYEHRFGWRPNPGHVIDTHGIGNAVGMAIQSMTEPGDGIVIFTPVYHEFTAKIRKNGREVIESPLRVDVDGVFQLDLVGLDAKMTGTEKMMLISSPHNPAGRVWTEDELRQMVAFCEKHDLLLVSDEIHMDLVFSGYRHLPTALAVPEAQPRLIVLSAASKTFDIAGMRTGYAIIPDEALRLRYTNLHRALDIQVNRVGLDMTVAAYSPQGAAWVDELVSVLEVNAQVLAEGLKALPGLRVMPMQGTFLSWVDFENTGMPMTEVMERVQGSARIVPSPGLAFGTGGRHCLRFNIGTPRKNVEDAVARLQEAFADLQ